MDYRWIGSFHLIAAVVWVSGLLLLAIVAGVYAGKSPEQANDVSFLNAIRSWNRKVTSPAMLLLWLFGGILIVKSGDLFQPWLVMKLVVLLFLSAVHGKLSKTIRILAPHQPAQTSLMTRQSKGLIVCSVAAIILLAKFRTSLV
ncbi:CopD family protein [Klebsiella sp. BIGb0407]|uniref:CopD family protein n=1 Tax=Klebsiella sp. BIGb0407 TaxID=2940603 RepID=UPI002167B095|nr:CopD family protein [Klebsiella sp. BIGb0407]MCS3430494.1 putative membrane protein [Klebsiella sp. BIGb0407]